MPSAAMPCPAKTLPPHRVAGMSLTERLVRLPDPRRRRGVRHPFVSAVLIAASAIVADARSDTAIGQWAAAAPQTTPARLGTRVAGAFTVRIAPSAATIRRALERVCPDGPADLAGGDPSGATTVAADGKSARGSRNSRVPSAHLPTAMTGDGQTISQLPVPDKTNEITGFARPLAPLRPDRDRRHRRRAAHPARAHPLPHPGQADALPADGQEQPAVPVHGAAPAALEPGRRPPCGPQPRAWSA
ncbi:transposase family protein [Streptomyces jumonjinensis]|uniref:Transposase family protein n=1 Tax=Streptomyces jumonjinensis TaxID=1945 RepID=A0A646KID1_STRJU|nr:transposase family protein [Streptomyces jumonjinensis]